MSIDPNQEEKFVLSLSDVWRLYRRAKKKIFFGAISMGLLGALIALTRPVEYQVEGTFREKSPKPANVGSSLIAMMMSGAGGGIENEAFATLKSRKLLQPVVEKLNLQGTITRKQDLDTYLKRMQDNAKVEYAQWFSPLYPALVDINCPLKLEAISFQEEGPLLYRVVFPEDREHYQLLDLKGTVVGEGTVNAPYQNEHVQFTLTCDSQAPLDTDPYLVIFWPMQLQTNLIRNKLKIETDKNDKNLLKISYQNRDRQLATQLVNMLMNCYADYLKETHDRHASLQLQYLKQRQEESGEHLAKVMENHANLLSQDLSSSGFADAEKEMEFLALRQHEFKDRLISNELEIKRLQNLQTGRCAYYDQYKDHDGGTNVINHVLEEIRNLKQQRDALEIALRKSSFLDPAELENAFDLQLVEIKEIQLSIQELEEMKLNYQQGLPVNRESKLFNDPRFLIKNWYEKVQMAGGDGKEKKHFLFYLDNLIRIFHVHEKIVNERLTHQQNPSSEFEGINLETAHELYIAYSKRLNELEGKMRENHFVIHQMEDPNFEISSLSTVITDPVSNTMITKASEIVLDLKDQNNRSNKEQERLKEELNLQRGFLQMHLQQANQLLKLHLQLVEEKIYALQNVTLELIHQRISVLEKNLYDYISARLDNLKQERLIIEQHMDELHQEMASLPHRWISEKLIQQNVEINELIVQEVAKMVESKNISHKLELIQSAPVDYALPPIQPRSNYLLLYSIFGAALGGLITFGTVLVRSTSRGLPASTTNLKLQQQYVAGHFSKHYSSSSNNPLKDQDLDTLHRLQYYFSDQIQENGNSFLLIEGKGPDYSSDLASLFIKKGKRVIRLFLTFESAPLQEKGLLQYLEGKAAFPEIKQGANGDFIEAGGPCRFSIELLGQPAFQKLLEKLKQNYDCIIAISQALPSSAEAESLLSLFPLIAVTIDQETLPDLEPYFKLKDSNKKVAFVMVSPDDV
jgi:tyrosine-protein kinase Etk/Wzc